MPSYTTASVDLTSPLELLSSKFHRHLSVDTVATYSQRVRDHASAVEGSQLGVLTAFIEIIKSLCSGSDIEEAIIAVAKLFNRSPQLTQDFSLFLPKEYEIYCPIEAPTTDLFLIVTPQGTKVHSIKETIPAGVPKDDATLREALTSQASWVAGVPTGKRLWSTLSGSSAAVVLQLLLLELDKEQTTNDYGLWFLSFNALKKLAEHAQTLPPSLFIRDIARVGKHPVALGGYSDIWKGTLPAGQVVCLKVLRFTSMTDVDKLEKEFRNEVLVWRILNHPRILQFLGVHLVRDGGHFTFGLVSPWMHNGNIIDYLREHPSYDRMSAIIQIADGLSYLHNFKPDVRIAHGDLKGANVFVKDDGTCCLADFGLAKAVSDPTSIMSKSLTTAGSLAGSARWMAPERLNPMVPTSSSDSLDLPLASDIYALGCTALEIITGERPWADVPNDFAVMFKIMQGKIPTRPPSISDPVWQVLEKLWKYRPYQRPKIGQARQMLKGTLVIPGPRPVTGPSTWRVWLRDYPGPGISQWTSWPWSTMVGSLWGSFWNAEPKSKAEPAVSESATVTQSYPLPTNYVTAKSVARQMVRW